MTRLIAIFAALIFMALPLRAEMKVQEVTTPLGLTAWLVEDHTIPFVALELRFSGGNSLDAEGKRGATGLMTALLEEGAGDMDARAFSRALEAQAASFGYSDNSDAIAISAKFLTENTAASMELLRASLVSPSFNQASIDRVKAQVVSAILSDLKDPSEIARAAFNAQIYGSHPYGSDAMGTVDSVGALTRDDLLAAHKAALTQERAYIGVVGDITAAELAVLLDSLLGDLPKNGGPVVLSATPAFDGKIKVIPFDTPQSVALFAQPGVKFQTPEFFAAYLLDLILGGGSFESRLMNEVREKRGLTYGVGTYLAGRDHGEIWAGNVASANERVAEAISVIKDQWTLARDIGVTAEELENAKTFLTGAYPLRFSGNGRIANILVSMQRDDMPLDYIATRNDRLNAVTLEEVNALAKRKLDPDLLTFVVVGKPEGLE